MSTIPAHPNDDGDWSRLEGQDGVALWRRDRVVLGPVTMFYLVSPPRQTEILYDEEKARAAYERASQR